MVTLTELAPWLAFNCALLVLNQLPLPLVLHPTRLHFKVQLRTRNSTVTFSAVRVELVGFLRC